MDYPHRSGRRPYHPAVRIYTPVASFYQRNDDRSFHRLYGDLLYPDYGQPLFQGAWHALDLALEPAAGGVTLLKFLYRVFENGVLDGQKRVCSGRWIGANLKFLAGI